MGGHWANLASIQSRATIGPPVKNCSLVEINDQGMSKDRRPNCHARIQEFASGGGGGGGGGPCQSDKKKLRQRFFSPQLILQKSMVNFKENYHFSRFQRGSNIFPGGGGSNFF